MQTKFATYFLLNAVLVSLLTINAQAQTRNHATGMPEQHMGNAPDRPNIIYILADDLGYGDVGCYGQKVVKTAQPRPDGPAGHPLYTLLCWQYRCAPSRCALMTS